jgi:hypothetical protein
MFFLITNTVIGKYYPNLVTQLILGFTCYMLSFLIIKDVIGTQCFNEYKYYILLLAVADVIFIVYKAKNCMDNNGTKQSYHNILGENKSNNTTSESRTGGMHSVTLSSEINDFKITHDLSLSESNNENSMFSTSDDKSETIDPTTKINLDNVSTKIDLDNVSINSSSNAAN